MPSASASTVTSKLRTRFEAYLVTIFSRQGVGNAYLSVYMIRAFDGNLDFFWLMGVGDLIIFSTVLGRMALGFSFIVSSNRKFVGSHYTQ